MALARALRLGLHDSSLDGFYHVARALCVHREADLDAFDQAFASHFRGIASASLETLDALDDWLQDPRNRKELTDAERAELQAIDMEELRKLFEERMKEQKERHDGGNRWVGTGGTSPFGAHGAHPSGVRVGKNGGGRSAMAVADARLYKGYRSDLVLDVRQIEVALRKLRALERTGAADELDLDETIAETAKNAGELEIVVRPPRRPNVRILLLMDVGGSMDPYADLVSRLFSAAKRASNLREVKTYYFHNCIYGHVYPTGDFQSEPIKVEEVFEGTTPEWRLVMVGDAAMHPAELTGYGDWAYYAQEGRGGGAGEGSRGLDWMMRISEHYKKGAWLNPEPPQYWRSGTAEVLSRVFPMYQLTLDGLGDAVAHLAGKRPKPTTNVA
jgi:uncharacterized protein with von Willebrand factor type A (vWA) domain